MIFVWGIEFDLVLALGSDFFFLFGRSKLTLRAEIDLFLSVVID